jgi:hypothetical protein
LIDCVDVEFEKQGDLDVTDEQKTYAKETVHPLLVEMINGCIQATPEDPKVWMRSYLARTSCGSANGSSGTTKGCASAEDEDEPLLDQVIEVLPAAISPSVSTGSAPDTDVNTSIPQVTMTVLENGGSVAEAKSPTERIIAFARTTGNSSVGEFSAPQPLSKSPAEYRLTLEHSQVRTQCNTLGNINVQHSQIQQERAVRSNTEQAPSQVQQMRTVRFNTEQTPSITSSSLQQAPSSLLQRALSSTSSAGSTSGQGRSAKRGLTMHARLLSSPDEEINTAVTEPSSDNKRIFYQRSRYAPPLRRAGSPPRRNLADIAELRIHKAGLLVLESELIASEEARNALATAFSKRPDGSPLIRSSFLKRLLQGQVELQGSLGGDISSASADLRHLSLEQLLAIRVATIDFRPVTDRHGPHRNFLTSVDQYLFEKFARRLFEKWNQIGEDGVDVSKLPKKPEPWKEIGRKLVQIVGAADCIATAGWAPSPSGEPMPDLWVVPLAAESWPQGAVLFDSKAISMRFLFGERPTYEAETDGASVAVITDRTKGNQISKEQVLCWEIATLTEDDDIHAEVARLSGEKTSQAHMSMDLSNAISQSALRRGMSLPASNAIAVAA